MAHAHLRHLNPFPANLGDVVKSYPAVLVPEVNLGQLRKLVRADFLVDAQGLNKVNGLPFRRADVQRAILAQLEAMGSPVPGLVGHGNGNGHAQAPKEAE